jgi:hypothetical protein
MTGDGLIGRKVDSRARQQEGPKHGKGNRTRLKILLQSGTEKKKKGSDTDGRSGKTTLKSPNGIRI